MFFHLGSLLGKSYLGTKILLGVVGKNFKVGQLRIYEFPSANHLVLIQRLN